jgi:membrane-bound lytic murein transglycosylase B
MMDVTHQDFSAFLRSVRSDAVDAGLDAIAVGRALDGLQPRLAAIASDQAQPEHAITAGNYFQRLVSDKRIAAGRVQWADRPAALARLEAAYGVDGAILLSIWGVESNFGAAMGDAPVIQSLATLAAQDTRRQAFWRRQLLAALKIVGTGTVGPRILTGSWAGAMGHTQFMPTTYLEHAVDFDGDGVRDIWNSVEDALASTANYLRHSGWRPGLAWGAAVAIGPLVDFAAMDPFVPRAWQNWLDAGVVSIENQRPLDADNRCRLILPAGLPGPAFVVTPNFDAILAYNRSRNYALSVGCLADHIGLAAPPCIVWPHEEPLSHDERVELQQRLADAGLDTNGIDGILGTATLRAVRTFQLRNGLRADGHPGAELLRFMRTNSRDTGASERC